jgi:hypothetical protein
MGLKLARVGVAVAAAAALLSGCATGYLLDNQVQSFSQLQGAPAPYAYRFDRSLSQQMDPAQQALEALADPVLHRAGLRRDDAAPRYTVQVTARSERMLSPYADPWTPFGWGLGFGGRHFGIGFGGGFPRGDQPWYRREVGVVVRELPANRVVYETRAFNDGPWLDNNAVLPAMFEAALQGFPNPPQGARRVDIHVGGKTAGR